MIQYRKHTNGKSLMINLLFFKVRLSKTAKEGRYTHPIKRCCQVNRWENGYCDFFVKIGCYSLHLNNLKLSEGKRYYKTYFKTLRVS